jgi:hypothetical protein
MTQRDTGSRGPCAQCAHVRDGTSIATTSFQIILRSVQPAVRTTHLQAAEKELDAQGELQKERDYLRQTGRTEWRRRPTDSNFTYCGLDELEGKFYACEVKNVDQDCADFTPAHDPRGRFCKSCAFNRAASEQIFQTLIQILGEREKGRNLADDTKKSIETQAQNEYQECVDFVGFVRTKPGLLPVCEAYSSADDASNPRYLIGPIVNAGNACPKWSAGANESAQQALAGLKALQARAQRALGAPLPPPPRGLSGAGGLYSNQIQRHHEMQGNAFADVVEYSLLALGANSDYALSVSTMFAASVCSVTRTPGGLNASGSLDDPVKPGAPTSYTDVPTPYTAPYPAAPDALTPQPQLAPPVPQPFGAQPAPQPFVSPPYPAYQPDTGSFAIQPSVFYAHPRNPALRLVVTPQPPNGVAWVMLPNGATQTYDLGTFQPSVWTQLVSPFGPLPILLNVTLPNFVFGTWAET